MKKSVNKNKQNKLLTKRNLIITTLALLIVTPFVVYGYNKWLDDNDYKRFMSAKASVEEVGSRLKAALPEMDWSTEASCSRGNVPFGEGSASCDIVTLGTSAAIDGDNVKSIFSKYDKVLSDSQEIIYERRKGEETPTGFIEKLSEGYIGGGYTSTSTGMTCSPIKEIISRNGNTLVKISFSCGDAARNTWFPRSDI